MTTGTKVGLVIGCIVFAAGMTLLVFREKIFGKSENKLKKDEGKTPSGIGMGKPDGGGGFGVPPQMSDENKKKEAERLADLLSGRRNIPTGGTPFSRSNFKMIMETRYGYRYDETTKQAVKI